jgi:hypothetical protein
MQSVLSVSLAALLVYATLFGQSATPTTQPKTFHVEGTIRGPRDYGASGVEVRFDSESVHKTVITDGKALYSVDLPIGTYTMTVQAPKQRSLSFSIFRDYVRPLFRVTSPTTLVLNGTLYFARPTCDIAVINKSGELTTQEQREKASQNACGGEDYFPYPSQNGVPFQLYVQYPKRLPTERGYIYSSDTIYDTEAPVPVFVAYNLFSLEANKVIYDAKSRTIEASGNVVVLDESGATKRADSMTFNIENGQATLIQ